MAAHTHTVWYGGGGGSIQSVIPRTLHTNTLFPQFCTRPLPLTALDIIYRRSNSSDCIMSVFTS